MRMRWKRLSLPILLLAVAVAAALWQWRAASALETDLSALREGAYYSALDALANADTDLSKVFVAASPGRHALLLGRVSSLAASASENLSRLPAAYGADAAGLKFLSQAADYAQTLATAAAEGRTLSADDLSQLSQMQEKTRELRDHLQRGAGFTYDTTLSAENASGIEYPSLLYDGPFSDGLRRGEPRGLPQETVTAEQAVSLAAAFVGAERAVSSARAVDTQGPLPTYGVRVETADLALIVEITARGGKALWMSPETAGFEATLPLAECALRAEAFLSDRGFGRLTESYAQQYDGLAVISFVPEQDGVMLYPDLLKAQVRMDTGEVVGLEANNYWMNHRERADLAPALSREEAQERVSGRLTLDAARLCVIPVDDGRGTGVDEALCWEFGGLFGGSRYLVYIDANTGKEREVLKLVETDGGVLTL